jgi:DNA polymerase-3 subunit epsilon
MSRFFVKMTYMPRGPLAIAPRQVAYTLPLHPSEVLDRALILDTETTGRSLTAEIIEVAVCDLHGRLLFESLARPSVNHPRSAARLHQLAVDDLLNAPSWEEVWRELAPLLDGKIVVAWNANYDRRMIESMVERYALSLPEIKWRCAMQFAKEKLGLRRSLTLEDACRRFEITPGTHRAETDVRATAKLLQLLLSA